MSFASQFVRRTLLAGAPLALLVCASCDQRSGPAMTGAAPAGDTLPATTVQSDGLLGRFKHIVVVVQENRTPDNLFQGLKGADIASSGLNSLGQVVALAPQSFTDRYDIQHTHDSFVIEYAHGKLDGFDLAPSDCGGSCPPANVRAYAYVEPSQTRPYMDMAEQYAFGDRMFQTNQGPSFPAHLYEVAGTSAPQRGSGLRIADNPRTPKGGATAGCDSPPGTLAPLIDRFGRENVYAYPCTNIRTIFGSLADQHRTWRYYQAHKGGGLWNAPDAFRLVRDSSTFKEHVVFPPTGFYFDVRKGRLADVSFVTPTAANSDHAGLTNKTGPAWVASIVNTIGQSRYWKDTAIIITWDDWGGWYDHVAPKTYNSYELGFRVPLIVISPYTPKGYVSHRQHEFGSILKFIEETMGVASLGSTDVRSDDLSDCFDFNQSPRQFVKIPAAKTAAQFLHDPVSTADIDP